MFFRRRDPFSSAEKKNPLNPGPMMMTTMMPAQNYKLQELSSTPMRRELDANSSRIMSATPAQLHELPGTIYDR